MTRLFVQPFPAAPGALTPRLLLDVVSNDCAVLNPPSDPCCPILECMKEAIRSNRLSLAWVLYSSADENGYAGGRWLKERFVAARIATGVWSERAAHNHGAGAEPDRLLAEGECIQLGSSFGRVRHVTDDEHVYTGYLFEHFACLGLPSDRIRPLEPDPFDQLPGARLALA